MGKTGNSGHSQAAADAAARRPKVSAKVYRRRRLVVLVLVLLVMGGLVAGGFFIAGLLGSGPDAGPGSESAANGSTAKPNPPAKPGTPPSAVCDEAGIKVSAATDKPSYGPDESPILTLRVTNTGQAPCDINVGTSQMEYQITSGADVIFNSRDCQLDSTDLVKNLKPGASETANFVWQVKRSSPECATVTAAPGRGGATYVLVATMGKWSSEKVTFTLN
ncbi:hypothetical protein [Arthrobacter sp.]|uniref:hypothetical protein n=1 Tax=Arthrobacter sp. TaxID=1667 RepID=UPI0026E10D4B|nr:hypothetical protein [Arthrobacter sp.]MDO5752943.1 hypothetical protein [Arthrobacter sp.]